MGVARWLLPCRRFVQWSVLLLLVLLPWLQAQDVAVGLYGTWFACSLGGVPLADPLYLLQVVLCGLVPLGALWLGALLVLVITALFGRVGCGWLCPFGALSEAVAVVRRRLTVLFSSVPQPDAQSFFEQYIHKHDGFVWRRRIAVCALAGTAFLGIPVANRISLPGILSVACLQDGLQTTASLLSLLWPVLLVLGLEAVAGTRFWCRWCCPQSAVLSWVTRWQWGIRLRRNPALCVCPPVARVCHSVCPLGLRPDDGHSASVEACMQCGRCVLACTRVCKGRHLLPHGLACSASDHEAVPLRLGMPRSFRRTVYARIRRLVRCFQDVRRIRPSSN